MKKAKFVIIISIIAVILGMTFFQLYLIPKFSDDNLENVTNDTDAITQDFNNVLIYKTKYMGNNSNIININNNLPLSNIKKSFSIHPETFAVEINYDVKASSIEQKKLEQAIIYNATVNFVLVGNLESLNLNFNDITYTISRSSLKNWYGVNLSSFENIDKLKKGVQSKLSNKTYLDKFMEEVVQK
ncbi:DUF4825 domain-containing protein [Clostridium akagii]|uniref:DUF4825 domain-containing protein n=1 Tax=Clostridium akagii TaxID=91623 RepID=UPI00047ABB55|nr:DUF4825 domain-containing protein [Clostridium akagii]